ncbi:glycosyltransferase [Ruegeria sp. 2012CJ41-6]|uniref:Glycosyltransferase n=1 Tax=Ruegeria spongiae TaxID=2942209 RepID=A0ABT0Q6Y9_9RHOB|nr:glycosyltransferase [Ruegeria spongiae]MCL6285644.1 glycosyltransferase [Ruegeria spongiae]
MTRVDIALCTFRRPAVRETLASLAAQDLPADVSIRVIVADNDDSDSARATVEDAAASLSVPVQYVHAPARNISIARNACLDAANADWVAFLDDDERAEPDWLARLLACATQTGADAVFGPALAEYGPEAPGWMRQQDHHSNHPARRGDEVETGHTCNALLRWRGAPWQDQRFDLARGRSGGEDTELFFRLHHAGARFEICEEAIVREAVAPDRLELSWLLRRKYRAGQSFAARAGGIPTRTALMASAAAKALFCAAMMLATCWSPDRCRFWYLRGAMHLGVISGCLSLAQPEIYGRG